MTFLVYSVKWYEGGFGSYFERGCLPSEEIFKTNLKTHLFAQVEVHHRPVSLFNSDPFTALLRRVMIVEAILLFVIFIQVR